MSSYKDLLATRLEWFRELVEEVDPNPYPDWLLRPMGSLLDLEKCLERGLYEFQAFAWGSEPERDYAASVATLAIEMTRRALRRLGMQCDTPPLLVPNRKLLEDELICLLAFVRDEFAFRQWANRGGRGDEDVRPQDQGAQDADGGDSATPNQLVLDDGTFTVRWRDRDCMIGYGFEWKLLKRLSRRPGYYVRIDTLLEEVWETSVSKGTVQKTASNLRRKLRRAGMEGLVIDGKRNRGHLALLLGPERSQ